MIKEEEESTTEDTTTDTTSSSSTTSSGSTSTSSTSITSDSSLPAYNYLTVDQYLERVNIGASTNVVLLGEILLSVLVLWTTDTLHYYGNVVDYTAWSCGADPDTACLSQTSTGTVYNRSTLCSLADSTTGVASLNTFAFKWKHSSGESFSTEYGMLCSREDESRTILDIYGMGAGLGALAGGIIADLFGRSLCFKLSVVLVMISLLTTVFCATVQILTLGLFSLGFSVYMALTSLTIWTIELLPRGLRYLVLTAMVFLSYTGTLLGYGLRVMCYTSWRLLDMCLVVGNLALISIIVHTPLSPRYSINKDTTLTRITLARLGVELQPEERIIAPQNTDNTESEWNSFNSSKHKHLFCEVLKLLYLKAVIGLTTNASAGKLWELTDDPGKEYPIRAAMDMISIPIVLFIFLQQYNIKFTLQIIGWVVIGCYFIGEIPLGEGIYNISNVVNVVILPLIRVIYVLVLFLILENMPTCYRGTVLGLSIAVEKCFLKLGKYILSVDNPSYDHGNSFLVFGVVYLSFVYAAGLLPSNTPKRLPNNIRDYNRTFCTSLDEGYYLLSEIQPHDTPASRKSMH